MRMIRPHGTRSRARPSSISPAPLHCSARTFVTIGHSAPPQDCGTGSSTTGTGSRCGLCGPSSPSTASAPALIAKLRSSVIAAASAAAGRAAASKPALFSAGSVRNDFWHDDPSLRVFIGGDHKRTASAIAAGPQIDFPARSNPWRVFSCPTSKERLSTSKITTPTY
jgi:hypothetical protein